MTGSDWFAIAIVSGSAVFMSARLLRRVALLSLGAALGCGLVVAVALTTRLPWCPADVAEWCDHGTIVRTVGQWIDEVSDMTRPPCAHADSHDPKP